MSTPAPTLELPVYAPNGATPAQDFVSQDVSAWFGDHKVLDRVSLSMPARMVTALMFNEPIDPRTADYVNGRFG